MTPDIEVSRDIAASPAAVFAALTDITRMGEWSPETYATEWLDGASTAEVGASFMGHNHNGDKEWSTKATIVELVENERFFFDCSARDFVFAKWGYSIEPTDDGCRVTEYTQDLRPEEIKERGSSISGVTDRLSHNRAGMEVTLERLAAAVESDS
ncbi:MAG: SRPBCC family protein [Acidimicrobiales bacterium]